MSGADAVMSRALAGPPVSLVLMPYAALERPSIALSILKAALARVGIVAEVVYGNLLFAEEIGAHPHDIIGKTQSHSLGGEWTFASAAFPEYEPGDEAYFAHIEPGLRALLPLVRRQGGRGTLPGILRAVRQRTPDFIDRFARRIVARRPRIVGCSSTFQQHCSSLALLRRVKALDPGIVTAIGGANCESSMGVATHRECPWVDYLVSGEADDVFVRLCERVLAGDDDPARGLEGVIGPAARASGGRAYAGLFRRPPRARVAAMDTSPMPDYDDYYLALEESPVGVYVKPGLLVETSRGCWWGAASHCTFCGLNGTNMAFRSKSPERVLDELEQLSTRYRTRTFEVVDNILDLAYFKTVVPALGAREEPYNLFYETKANLSRAQLGQLAAAGIRWLQPGIESLDDGILKAIAKGTTARQNLQLMKWARECGIYVLWILLYDIPGESDDAYRTMAGWLPLVSHLQPPSGISFIQFNRFSPYHMRPDDFGLTLSPDRAYRHVYPWAEESLEHFAYFFDDYTKGREHIDGAGRGLERPGLRSAFEVVAAWQEDWLGYMNASAPETAQSTLLMEADGEGGWRITDTRRCRVADEFRVCGLAARVYEACDRAQTRASLLRELAASGVEAEEDAVLAALAELCAQKLMLDLDGRYFSLALRAPLPPLAKIVDYPGGRLRTVLEADAATLYRAAEQYVAGTPAEAEPAMAL